MVYGQGHITHFLFDARCHISGTAEARVAIFCMHYAGRIRQMVALG